MHLCNRILLLFFPDLVYTCWLFHQQITEITEMVILVRMCSVWYEIVWLTGREKKKILIPLNVSAKLQSLLKLGRFFLYA